MGSKRFLTGIILIPVLYVLIKYLPSLYFLLVVAIVVVIGQHEFYRFYFKKLNRFSISGIISGFLLLITFYEGRDPILKSSIMGIILFGTFLIFLFFKQNIRDVIIQISIIIFGIMYVAWTLGHLISLRELFQGKNLLFFILIVTYSVDTGAYYTGRLFGRHKLAPRISPGKTIEGGIGGVISAVIGAFIGKWLFMRGLQTHTVILTGLIFGVMSQLGDLSESLLKRSAGVKDSGSLIPAHGGVLDRVDSLIFTAPAFYYYIHYFIPEVARFPV